MALLGPTTFRSSSISAQGQNAIQYKCRYCVGVVKVISLMALLGPTAPQSRRKVWEQSTILYKCRYCVILLKVNQCCTL